MESFGERKKHHWNTYQNSKVVESVALRWVFFKNNIFSENICKYLKLFVFIFKKASKNKCQYL